MSNISRNVKEAGIVAAVVTNLACIVIFSKTIFANMENENTAGILNFALSLTVAMAVYFAIVGIATLVNRLRNPEPNPKEVKARADAAIESAGAAKEEYDRIYGKCEFCGGELEFKDEKGGTHNSSYKDGYSLEVNSSTTATIRENRVSYHIDRGTHSYHCPACRYTVRAEYERFNSILESHTGIEILAKEGDSKVSREQIKNGRLYKAFNIVASQIYY